MDQHIKDYLKTKRKDMNSCPQWIGPAEITDLKEELESWTGATLSEEMVEVLILNSRNLRSEISSWGVCDTETRSTAMNALSLRLIGMKWPINGDSQDFKDLHDKRWAEALELLKKDPNHALSIISLGIDL